MTLYTSPLPPTSVSPPFPLCSSFYASSSSYFVLLFHKEWDIQRRETITVHGEKLFHSPTPTTQAEHLRAPDRHGRNMLTGFLRNSEFTSIQGSFSIQIYQIPVQIYQKLLKCHILSTGEKRELFLCCPCRRPRIEVLCPRGGDRSQGQCWKPQDDTDILSNTVVKVSWMVLLVSQLPVQAQSPEWEPWMVAPREGKEQKLE